MLQSFEDFRNRFMNCTVEVGRKDGQPIFKSLGKAWLEHPARRQYLEMRFLPGQPQEVGDYLNLWRGWGIEPRFGDWSLMKGHILNVLADGNEVHSEYILNWAAYAVQHPDEPAEVALVFKGAKGAGKGLFARAIKRVFGQHGLHITSSAHLTGRFNAHLRDCCLLFADEAIAAGDKAAESVLKGLITEPELPIEGKGVNVIQARNRLHIVMASNERWVIPAGADERRFAIFDVSRNRIGDKAYFDALTRQMQNGGLAAMLHDLLHRPIEDWHPRHNVPDTEALKEQKEHSLTAEDQFILSILEDGVLPGARIADKKNAVYSSDRQRTREPGLFTEMARISPELSRLSTVMLTRIVKEWGAQKTGTGAARGWVFPDLAPMRAQWDRKYGPRQWPDMSGWADDDRSIAQDLDFEPPF